MPRPQTIQIYLPAGDPRGMRVAEITTRIVRVVEVPRSQLGEFLKMPEALQVGVYFLIGELSDSGLPRVYIGQSGNVGKRLVQHNQDTYPRKDFWSRALVMVSETAATLLATLGRPIFEPLTNAAAGKGDSELNLGGYSYLPITRIVN
jgi:hypothetical protein